MPTQEDTAGSLGALFVICLGLYVMDWSPFKNQITDYTLRCTANDYINNRCDGSYVKGPVTVYTVNVEQQFVIQQIDGEAPARMTHCVISDRRNWKCDDPNGNELIVVVYTDGNYRGILVPPFYKHVERYEWLWADKASLVHSPPNAVHPTTSSTIPQIGEVRTLPNGAVGRWDGTGWEEISEPPPSAQVVPPLSTEEQTFMNSVSGVFIVPLTAANLHVGDRLALELDAEVPTGIPGDLPRNVAIRSERVDWQSDNPNVLVVNQSGAAIAVGPGVATVSGNIKGAQYRLARRSLRVEAK